MSVTEMVEEEEKGFKRHNLVTDGTPRRRTSPRRPATLSSVVEGIELEDGASEMTVADLVSRLGPRVYPVTLFLFGALNVVPAPPGTSTILGLPLVIIAFLACFGRPFWLPHVLLRLSFDRTTFERQRKRVIALLTRLERGVQPRGRWIHLSVARHLVDLQVFLLSLCVLVPLPFTAMLPAFCICIISVGQMERDGRWIAVGAVLGGLAILVSITLITAAATVLGMLIS